MRIHILSNPGPACFSLKQTRRLLLARRLSREYPGKRNYFLYTAASMKLIRRSSFSGSCYSGRGSAICAQRHNIRLKARGNAQQDTSHTGHDVP